MKEGIHPKYHEIEARCACGATWKTRSTKPELHLEICNNCHPFFTGRQKLIDTEGRVERFTKRFGVQTSESRKAAAKTKKTEEDRRRRQVARGAGSAASRELPETLSSRRAGRLFFRRCPSSRSAEAGRLCRNLPVDPREAVPHAVGARAGALPAARTAPARARRRGPARGARDGSRAPRSANCRRSPSTRPAPDAPGSVSSTIARHDRRGLGEAALAPVAQPQPVERLALHLGLRRFDRRAL